MRLLLPFERPKAIQCLGRPKFLGSCELLQPIHPQFLHSGSPTSTAYTQEHTWNKLTWNKLHQNAFESLKNILTSNSVMAHFDPRAPIHLRVDASPVGLGAILTQAHGDETRPVAYASRTLTPIEMRYSQTEREALAVDWGCEKFHLYLYGTTFDIYTGHKPLEIICGPTSKPPARIERWGLRLQPYKFRVMYSPGIGNPADVLSRLPLASTTTNNRNTVKNASNMLLRMPLLKRCLLVP